MAAPEPFSVSPLHFHSDEKGTSAVTLPGLEGKRSEIACRVRLRSPALAANCASARWTAPSSSPEATCTPRSISSPSVSVPVLSTQIVSTAASDSVALICWISVSRLASRTAATANVTLISSTRPSGISVVRPAVAVWAASRKPSFWALSAKRRITPRGTITQVHALITRLTSSWSGESGWRNARASPAIRPA